ncbi:MAG: c-type cytochrome [Geobacteraceae bacterium]|nr:c-type cytochrome [Geobacteraceae bacterium]
MDRAGHALFFAIAMEVVVLCAVICSLSALGEAASTDEGQTIFRAKCASCHTVGGGRLVGPDLKGVTATRDRDWLEKFIATPDKMIEGGDPVAKSLLKEYGGVAMPNLGLSSSQVEAVLAFLAQSTPGKAAAPATAPVVAPGDSHRGARLFTGAVSFQRGGAPCSACHTVSGVAPLGGGSLGPDLTGIYARLGAAGLPSVLATLPFPTMQPIYRTRPLAPQEQGDLAAFFSATAGRTPRNSAPRIIGLAAAGFLLLFVMPGVIWRRRLGSVRRALVEEMLRKGGAGE